MKQAEMEDELIKIVCQLQELSGREQVDVKSDTRPVVDVPDFDSLNGVELTVEIMDKFGIECEFNNALVEDGKPLTIAQAATRLLKQLAKV